MTATKTTKKSAKPAPVEKTKRSYAWVYTLATVIVGVASALLILGLATRGLETYIKGMSESNQRTAAIVGVSMLAFGVASLVRLGKR